MLREKNWKISNQNLLSGRDVCLNQQWNYVSTEADILKAISHRQKLVAGCWELSPRCVKNVQRFSTNRPHHPVYWQLVNQETNPCPGHQVQDKWWVCKKWSAIEHATIKTCKTKWKLWKPLVWSRSVFWYAGPVFPSFTQCKRFEARTKWTALRPTLCSESFFGWATWTALSIRSFTPCTVKIIGKLSAMCWTANGIKGPLRQHLLTQIYGSAND